MIYVHGYCADKRAPHGVHIPEDYLNCVYCIDGCNDPSLLIHLKILDICNQ